MRTPLPFARTRMRHRPSWTRGIAAFAVVAGVSLAMLFGNSPTAKGYSITASGTDYITTTGGGGYIGPANCPAGSVIYQMGATGSSGSTSLTQPVGTCADLNGAASLHNTVTSSIGTSSWGGAGNTTLTPVRCTSAQAVVGMVVHKQSNGYVAGWQLMCGTLPTGGSRTTDSAVFGWSNAGTASPSQRETIQCPTGMVAVGMVGYVGGILDRIGFRCGTISNADQAAVTITSSASISYASSLTLTSTGGSGSGATTYSTTGNCSVSGTTLTATGNAGTTCSVTATRAADTNYASMASSIQTVTIQKISNTISFTNPGTRTWSSTQFNVVASATSGAAPTITSSTSSVCTASGLTVTMVASGSCTLVASDASNTNYNAAPNVTQTFTINSTGRSGFTGNSSTISGTTTGTKYVVERFTTTGTSTWSVPQGVSSIDYLVVGGGAGGGSRHAGGGGAGGLRSSVASTGGGASPESAMTVTPGGSLTVTVGAGGASWTSGSDSVLGSITSKGGGTQATSGGSGGGSNYNAAGASGQAGQGFNGGSGRGGGSDSNWLWAGGGGGGAGASGSNAGYSGGYAFGGAGGAGVTNSITGSASCYGGGGGGGYSNQATNGGADSFTIQGGKCGSTMVGGTSPRGANATAGAVNTGSGGGGGGFDGGGVNYLGGAGGSGIVVVRYALPDATTPNLLGADDTGVTTDDITSTRTLRFWGSAPLTSSIQLSVATATSATDTDSSTGTWTNTGSACTANSTGGEWECTTAQLAPGLYKVRSTATTNMDGLTDTRTSSTALVVNIDNTAPTVSLARTGSGTLRSSQTDTITFTLSEASSDFVVGDITVSGGTLSSFTATSSTVYTVIFTPTASTQTGSGSVSVAAGVFTDAARNSNTASSATTISYDTAAPTMTVAASPSPVSSGATSTITFTASETTSTFTASDISTTLGTLSGFSGSGTTYTATFTASLSTGGTAVVTVASGSFADAQSNTNTTTFTGSLTISNTTSSSGGRTSYLANGTNGTNGTRYFVEQFTAAGTSTWTAPQGVTSVEYLIVAGGGGGAGGHATAHGGGGGGAGGYRTNAAGQPSGGASSAETALSVTAGTSYTVVVGAGGNRGAGRTAGTNGSNSQFASIIATGGGGGGSYFVGPVAGGSGGGAGASTDLITGANGTSGQGFKGGNTPTADFTKNGAGGGGSGGVGANGVDGAASAAGGIGTASSITGTSITRASGGTGGVGVNSTSGTSASSNTGNGGGGGSAASGVEGVGGNGGSGIVVVRYAVPDVSAPDLDASTDTGTSTDNITKATTLTFTGSAPVGSTVQLFADGVATGSTCVANSSTGAWSCTTGTLAAGNIAITAQSTTILDDSTVTSTSSGLTVTIDTTSPTVSLARTGSGTLKSGQTDTITFTLSEAATDFVVGDITVTGGTLSSFTTTSSTAYTVIFTPTADTASGSGSVSVAGATFTDAAGNSNTASSATTISYDTLAPTVSLVRTGSGTLKSGQTDTITFTLSEAATDFAVGDITVSGGTLSSFTATSSTVYTVIFTPTADTASGSGSISVAGATFTDAAGNSNTASSATTISYDTLAPTVSLARTGSGTLRSGQTDTITFTLSEAATDFAVGDITVSGGTLSSFTATSSTAYTVIFTPTADTATGSGSISVAGATFTDAAGNSNTASSATSISYDTLAPTVSLTRTGSGTLKSGQTDTITFTLSEAATDFAVGDITVTGGTLSSFTATSATVYSVVFTPTASTQTGSGSVSVGAGGFTDAVGNSNTASSATTISYDTLAPTVSLVRTGSGTLKSGQTDTITFTLSEAATDFAVGDITVSGGTLSSFTATSATVYSVVFTPTASTQSGSGSISVAGATFTDAAGNSNTASSATTISYDTLVPTVSLTRTGSGTLKSGQTDTITFTLSEAATDFAVGDITVTGGTLSSFTATSATVYSVVFTPTADTASGSGSVSVAGATFTDAAGNSNTASSDTTISYDTLAPTVSLVRTGSGTLKAGQTDTITITFSETGLFNGITVSGGTLSSFTATSSTVYTVIFTPTASTATGSGSLSVLAADFTDYAGNTNAASNVISITYDTLAPTATVSRSYTGSIGVRANQTITFTLSEASSTFTAADITVTGGSIGSLTTVSSTVYRVLFTPTADTASGTATLSVDGAKFTDAAGNDNTASNTLSIPFDTREPTVAITRAGSTSLRSGQTDIITFTLSEASSTFIASDITVTGGSIGTLTTTSSTVYSVVFTPATNTQSGTGSISVAAGRFTDATGNGNIASSTRSVPYDTLAATISNVNSSTANGTLGIGSSVSIQITFTEAVTVSGMPQLTLETGATDRTASYASGSGTSTLTFTYTVQSGDTSGDLDYASTSALALNGGSILDSVDNTAILTLPTPGTSGSLGANMAILVASEPTQIVSVRTPAGTASGAAFTTQPRVSLQDNGGSIVTSDNTTVVTATVGTGAALVGTRTATAVNGVVTFDNLGISGTAGTAYTITYSATVNGNALTVATQSVTPTLGAATQISITTQPVGDTAGALLSTQPVVKVLDSGNNIVTDSSIAVTVSASGGTLGGTKTVNATSGVTTFTGLTFAGTASTNYTLTFTTADLGSTISDDFSVGVGAPTQIIRTTNASGAVYSADFTTQPVVEIRDAGNNKVTTATNVVTATLSSGTIPGTTDTTLTATAASGVATFSGLGIAGTPGDYTITYSSGALTTASQSITLVKGSQTITFTDPTDRAWAAAAIELSPTATSGLTVTLTSTSTDVCTVSDLDVTMVKVGTCSLTASQSGNSFYNAATSVTHSFDISQASQSISFDAITNRPWSASTFDVSPSATSGLTVTVTSDTTSVCTVANSTVSMLKAGTCELTASQSGSTNYSAATSVPQSFEISRANQASISITTLTATYEEDLSLTTLGGSGDGAVTYTKVSGDCTLSNGIITPTAAGSCEITATKAADTQYASASVTSTIIINKANQSVALTLGATSVTYGQTLTLAGSGGEGNGAISYSVSEGTCTLNTAVLTPGDAGSACKARVTRAESANYNSLTSAPIVITVTRATPTLGTLALSTKTFGDSAFALTGPSATYDSASVAGAWSYSSAQTSVATIEDSTATITGGGTSVITATFSPTDSVNYNSTNTASTLTVEKATPTFSWSNVLSTYGDADFTIVSPAVATTAATGTWSYSSADTEVVSISSTKFDVGNAGSSVVTATFTPSNTTNYVSGETITMTVTVQRANQAALTISSSSGTYGTDLTLTTTGGTTDGSITWGVSNDSATGCAISSGKLATTSIGTCTVTATMAGNGNYNSVTNSGTTVTINAKPITVTATAKTKTYGDSDPTLTYTTATGALVGSDTLSGSLTRVTGDTVGEYTINQGTVANSNYDISYTSAKLTINAKPITVTAVAKAKTYGDTDPALTYTTATGALVGSDTLTGSLTRDAGDTVGEYTINQGTVANSNYDISYTSAKLTINAKPITVTATAKTKTYGDTDPTLTYTTATGALVGSDTLSGSLTRVTGDSVGEYTINQGTVDNSNYDISYTSAKLTLNAKPITVTATAKTKTYGDSDPALTYTTATGALVGSDSLSGSLTRDAGEDANSYTIRRGTVANTNYDITYIASTLTITQAQQSALSVTTANIVYRTPITLQAAGGSEGDLSFNVASSGTASCSIEDDTLFASGNAGSTCTVTATRAMTNNFVQKTSSPFTITVVPRTITLTATAKEKFYGDSDPGFTYVVTAGSLFGSDTFAGTQTRASGENVGTYTINKGSLANSNYTVTYVPALLTINQRPITVTATNKTKIFAESDPVLSYTVTTGNIMGSDVLTGSITRAPGETLGSYNITRGTLDNGNYNITFITGTFRITGAQQTGFALTASSYSVVYNASITLQTSGGNGNGLVSYASQDGTGSCSISGDSVTGTTAGTCSVTATKAAEGGYLESTSNAITITIEKADQTILMSQMTDRDFSAAPITVAPTSGSGSPVVLESRTPNVCAAEAFTISMRDSGVCSITASVAEGRNHNAAPSIIRSFEIRAVVPFAPAITSVAPSDATVTVTFTPGLSGGAAITTYRYSVDDGVRWTDLPDGTISSPIVIGNLPNDVETKVRIMAVNRIGNGARSNMKAATPIAKKSMVWVTERQTNSEPAISTTPSVGALSNQLPPSPALVRTQSVSGGRRTQVTATRSTKDANIPVTHAIITVRLKNGKLLARIQVLVDPNNPTTAVTIPYQSRRINVSVQFANNIGVSVGGTVGTNLRESSTFLETTINGRPRIAGTPIANSVSFAKGSSTLTTSAKAHLKKALKKAQAQGGLIYVTGYAQTGELQNSWILNALARERAKNVAQYFVSIGARQWITFYGAPITPTVWHNTPSGHVDIATVFPDQISNTSN